jgi:protein O-GlcNAc transferase
LNNRAEVYQIVLDILELEGILGAAQKGKGDLDAAIDSYKQALKIKPDFAEAYNNMGNALKDKGDLEAAIDSYQQALKINPVYAEAILQYGCCPAG